MKKLLWIWLAVIGVLAAISGSFLLGQHTRQIASAASTDSWDQAMKEYKLVKMLDSTQAVQSFQSYQLTVDSPLFGKNANLLSLSQIDGGYIYVYKVGEQTSAIALIVANQQLTWIPIPISGTP